METTHTYDYEADIWRQIVTPEKLKDILNEQGESYDPPSDFGVADEWNVAE